MICGMAPHRLWGLRLSEFDGICWDMGLLAAAERARIEAVEEALLGVEHAEVGTLRMLAAQVIGGL